MVRGVAQADQPSPCTSAALGVFWSFASSQSKPALTYLYSNVALARKRCYFASFT